MTITYLTKAQIRERLTTRAEIDFEAPALGGWLRLRELRRSDRSASTAEEDDYDRINIQIFAAAVIDPDTKEPLYSPEEALALVDEAGEDPGQRTAVWAAIYQVAQAALDLSEVGPLHLKSGGAAADAERGD